MERHGLLLSSAPFIRLLLPLCIGVEMQNILDVHSFFPILVLWGLTIALLFFLKDVSFVYQPFWGLTLIIVIIIFGFVRARSEKVIILPLQRQQYFVILEEYPVEKTNTYQVTCRLINSELKVLTYLPKSNAARNAKPGDIIGFSGRPELVENEGNPYEFNYQRYLNNKKIGYRVFLKENQFYLLKESSAMNLFRYALILRAKLIHILSHSGLSAINVPLVSSISFGAREEVDKDIIQDFSDTGVIHVLAVSGMNVGLVYVILDFFLNFLKSGKVGFLFHTLLMLMAIWGYAMVTGMSASILRAATMFTFVIIGRALHRNSTIYNSLAVSAFLLIAWDPVILGDVGFQLSYAAVLSIAIFQPVIYQKFEIRNWLFDKVWLLMSVTLAAQIGTLPFTILYFHQFPVYFWLANLVVIPLVTLILYLSFVVIAVSFVSIFLSSIGAWVLDWSIRLVLLVVDYVSNFPYAVLKGLYPTIWQLILICFALILLRLFLKNRRVLFLRGVLIMVIILSLSINLSVFFLESRAEIIFFNISGTRALALTSKRETIVLYDQCENPKGKLGYYLKPYLGERGIGKIDLYKISDSLRLQKKDIGLSGNFIFFRGICLYIEPQELKGTVFSATSCTVDLVWRINNTFKSERPFVLPRSKYLLFHSSDKEVKVLSQNTSTIGINLNKAVQLTIQRSWKGATAKIHCDYFN